MSKPKCKLVGTNGNVFALQVKVVKALKDAGLEKEANEVIENLSKCKSYDEALIFFMKYVEVE